jgi:hypothetical protein
MGAMRAMGASSLHMPLTTHASHPSQCKLHAACTATCSPTDLPSTSQFAYESMQAHQPAPYKAAFLDTHLIAHLPAPHTTLASPEMSMGRKGKGDDDSERGMKDQTIQESESKQFQTIKHERDLKHIGESNHF